jgi:cyanophycin synthetase
VGVVTNVTEDHLGLDGIDTIKDLAYVKALVAEAVKPNGFAVLNAEDDMSEFILESLDIDVILFYKSKENIKVKDYEQFILVFAEDGLIKIRDRKKVIDIIDIKDIPITYSGLLECNIDNCLAAVSAAYALDIKTEVIQNGLTSFQHNPGRFQIFEMRDYQILLDYAHNQAGYEQIIKLCEKISCGRRVGIIGMPGDRPDDAIKAAGALAAKAFDRIYIKEDIDLRDRQKNEVAQILHDAVLAQGFDPANVIIADTETDALKQAMASAAEGDFIIVLYEKMDSLIEIIENEQKS